MSMLADPRHPGTHPLGRPLQSLSEPPEPPHSLNRTAANRRRAIAA
jgi:hypothetical protein